jgi:lipid-A-disaccharide synthase
VEKLKESNSLIQVMVGKAPNVSLSPIPNDFKVEENARKAMVAGTVAIVSSGTATLECAVEDTTMVVCYKLSIISWWMANNMASVKYASMVNLIADENIVPEFLQQNMTEENLVKSVIPLLNSKSIERKKMLSGFDRVRRTLGMPGVYDRAAEAIISKTIVEHE